jgi:hypothetical protein
MSTGGSGWAFHEPGTGGRVEPAAFFWSTLTSLVTVLVLAMVCDANVGRGGEVETRMVGCGDVVVERQGWFAALRRRTAVYIV